MPQSTVVITGIGIVSSIGTGGDAYFEALRNGQSGIRSLAARTDDGVKPNSDSKPDGLWIGGPILDFDPKPYVRPRKALKVMCREIQTAYVASQLAIESADLEPLFPCTPDGAITPDRVGTVFGSEMLYGPPSEMLDTFHDSIDDNGDFDSGRFGKAAMRGVTPLWMLKYLPNMPACHVGIAINAHGPNNSLILGDVSGPAALMESVSCIQRGIADIMITGSTGTRINSTRLIYRNDLPIVGDVDSIPLSSRPHDPSSLGAIGGEGASTIVLESSDHAAGRGAKPIATIVATANRFVASEAMRHGQRSNQSRPKFSRGSVDAIRLAIEDAITRAHDQTGLNASEIGAVVSHGMGDVDSDSAEENAIRSVLPETPVVAPMASLGHTGSASGGMALATAALILKHQTIPATLNGERADGVNLLSKSAPLRRPYVLCLAHTSEGHATAVILAKG